MFRTGFFVAVLAFEVDFEAPIFMTGIRADAVAGTIRATMANIEISIAVFFNISLSFMRLERAPKKTVLLIAKDSMTSTEP